MSPESFLIHSILFSIFICFTLSIVGLVTESTKLFLSSNLHNILFTIQLSICSICILLYTLVKFTNKKKNFTENTVERKVLLSRDLELEEEQVRVNFDRNRTDSIVKQVNKSLLNYDMDENTMKLLSTIFRVLNGILLSCDERIKMHEQELGEVVTYGTVIKIYYYLSMNIAKLRNALESMIKDKRVNEEYIWHNIELTEYLPDNLDEMEIKTDESSSDSDDK